MPRYKQPASLLTLCHTKFARDLVSMCRSLQLLAQESSSSEALTTARCQLRPHILSSLPGSVRSRVLAESSAMLNSQSHGDSAAMGAGPAPLYLLTLLLAPDVRCLKVELCCYYGCTHQTVLLKLLAAEGTGLESLELSRSALLRLDQNLLESALRSASRLRCLVMRNIASDAALAIVSSACPNLQVLDVSNSRQVTDTGLRNLLLQVQLRDKRNASTATTLWARFRKIIRQMQRLSMLHLLKDEKQLKTMSLLLEYCESRKPLCDVLQVLNIANTLVTSTGVLLVLKSAPRLRSLGGYAHMGRALEMLDKAVKLQHSTQFSLKTAKSSRTTQRRLELISQLCPQLEQLILCEPNHTPSSLNILPPLLTSISLFSIPSLPEWTTGVYDYLALQGSKLNELALRFNPCEVIASLDLAKILLLCPNLNTLVIDSADVTWSSYDGPPLSSLQKVQIGKYITGEALMNLTLHAPNLTLAHFHTCQDLNEKNLIRLISSPTQCFYIYEAACLDMDTVSRLIATSPNLKQLGSLANWGLNSDSLQTLHQNVKDRNLDLEFQAGSHWFCSPCFPIV